MPPKKAACVRVAADMRKIVSTALRNEDTEARRQAMLAILERVSAEVSEEVAVSQELSFDEALQQLAELIANADDQARQKYYDLAKDVVDVIEPDLREASQERRHSPSPQPQQRPVRERAQQAVRELARAAAQPLNADAAQLPQAQGQEVVQQPENDDESAKSGDPPLINALLQRINELEARGEDQLKSELTQRAIVKKWQQDKQQQKQTSKEETEQREHVRQHLGPTSATEMACNCTTSRRAGDRTSRSVRRTDGTKQLLQADRRGGAKGMHYLVQKSVRPSNCAVAAGRSGKHSVSNFNRCNKAADTRYAQAWKKTPATAGVQKQPWKISDVQCGSNEALSIIMSEEKFLSTFTSQPDHYVRRSKNLKKHDIEKLVEWGTLEDSGLDACSTTMNAFKVFKSDDTARLILDCTPMNKVQSSPPSMGISHIHALLRDISSKKYIATESFFYQFRMSPSVARHFQWVCEEANVRLHEVSWKPEFLGFVVDTSKEPANIVLSPKWIEKLHRRRREVNTVRQGTVLIGSMFWGLFAREAPTIGLPTTAERCCDNCVRGNRIKVALGKPSS